MTIRIHEADGTPYEHVVEIKEANTRFEIPYNTKYKRLKRSRRQKERTTAVPSAEPAPDASDDVLLYCLGDVLQSEDEVVEWRLHDWPKEEEDKMSQESYEWIRMDADFEWICKMHMNMPAYMYISQLQQDRDVVAQLEVRRTWMRACGMILIHDSLFNGSPCNESTGSYRPSSHERSWIVDISTESGLRRWPFYQSAQKTNCPGSACTTYTESFKSCSVLRSRQSFAQTISPTELLISFRLPFQKRSRPSKTLAAELP